MCLSYFNAQNTSIFSSHQFLILSYLFRQISDRDVVLNISIITLAVKLKSVIALAVKLDQ